ncbi:hypothetical protein [Leptodesmis sichuanensis]
MRELSNRSALQLTRLLNPVLFSDPVTKITGAGLDSSLTHPTDSHLPVLVQKSTRSRTDNTKTDIVVAVVRIVVVAIGRTTVPGIVVPRTTAQQPEVPAPSSPPCKYQ